jgi:hypothetical protein
MCLLCPARVPNITMHLSRRRIGPVHPTSTLRPGDGERCFDRVSTVVVGA